MLDSKALLKRSKQYRILYAEDDMDIVPPMLNILKSLFHSVTHAKDGKTGLKLFRKGYFDLVISDIQMPHMNDLDMIEAIKHIEQHIPVIVTTAYSDKDFFLKSIDIGIDKYLIKPIDQAKLFSVLSDVCMQLENRKEALQMQHQEIRRQVNMLSEFNINQIIESSNNPTVIYTDDKINYFNTAFTEFFTPDTLKTFVSNHTPLQTLFLPQEGYITDLDELECKQTGYNKVVITIGKGKKIFNLSCKNILFSGWEKSSSIFTFYDITLLEYEKNRTKNYSEVLEEIIISNRRSQHSKIQKEPKPVKTAVTVSKDNKLIETTALDKDILRRSRHNLQYSSIEYMETIDGETSSQLEELQSSENELGYLLDVFKDNNGIPALLSIAKEFEGYADVIGELLEFEDLAYAIRSFCKMMNAADETLLDNGKMEVLAEFMAAFLKDLSFWRKTVFIDRSAKDIHYLDSSLLSSCMQIEVILYSKENIDENEELIFF